MIEKLLEELPFKIGEEFELNEFNVDSEYSLFIGGIEYEIYTYIKDDIKSIFGLEVKSTQLYYNADILHLIKYDFNTNSVTKLVNNINLQLPLENKEIITTNKERYIFNNIFLTIKENRNIVELYISTFRL